ncbi:MAG: crossover junction endodeoxyribonuclease RuvC [Oscillospiraceae bacterium]|nr:crossover junction endodeoxyribonuclease RuvC [Oscillospiraceae bacterium]
MKILGIDPGYGTTGFGLVEADRNNLQSLRYGAVTTPKDAPFEQRLAILYDDIAALLETYRPDAVSVEQLFWGHNITTGIGVSHGRGVILLAIAKAGVPLFEYTPMQVKQAVVGYGNATKKQVMEMTRRLLKLDKIPRPDDAADALALAVCHGRSATSMLAQIDR